MYANATARRVAEVAAVVETWLDNAGNLIEGATRDAIRDDIGLLFNLGRTGRWQTAILGWKGMVGCEDNDLRWALLQGQVGAIHAA